MQQRAVVSRGETANVREDIRSRTVEKFKFVWKFVITTL